MSEPYRSLPPMRVTSTAGAVGAVIARKLNGPVTETRSQAPRAAALVYDDVTEDEGWVVPAPKPAPKPTVKSMTLGDLARMRAPANVEESVDESRVVVLPDNALSRNVSLVARMLGSRKR